MKAESLYQLAEARAVNSATSTISFARQTLKVVDVLVFEVWMLTLKPGTVSPLGMFQAVQVPPRSPELLLPGWCKFQTPLEPEAVVLLPWEHALMATLVCKEGFHSRSFVEFCWGHLLPGEVLVYRLSSGRYGHKSV